MPRRRSGLDDPRQPDDAGLDELVTEAGSQPRADYDLRATLELVELMNAEDATVPAAVAASAQSIAAAVDAISDCLARGGRLIYVGAGSSGRIAALDASECESTFSVPPETVVSLVAGGTGAPSLEQEAAEDDRERGSQGRRRPRRGRRRHRRRHQRQWKDALRAQRDRGGRPSGRLHRLRRLRAGVGAREARRPSRSSSSSGRSSSPVRPDSRREPRRSSF